MDRGTQEERKYSDRVLERKRSKSRGRIIGAVIAGIAICLLTFVFSPIDIGMILAMLGAGIAILSVGVVIAALSIFPRLSQASITLGLILIAASLVLGTLASIYFTIGNSRLPTP
jgi:hypothetical protein